MDILQNMKSKELHLVYLVLIHLSQLSKHPPYVVLIMDSLLYEH